MINIYRNKIFNSKFLSLFLCLIMFSVSIGLGNFSYAQLQYATSFSTSSDLLGSGTEKDPYQITDAEHLKQMQESNKKSSCFILLKNIKVESHNPISNFSGTFDGNGFTITINKFDSYFTHMGLFGSAIGATIKNVNVLYSAKVSISFSSTIDGAEVGCFGGICASATASSTKKCIIENCNNFSVNISFSSKGEAIGGIVGTATDSTEIKNCTNRSNLIMTTGRATHYGGIVGYSTNKISYCSNYGDISGTATYAGGIVGRLSADLTYCYNLSSSLSITNKTNTTCYIGGIVGKTSGEVECSTNDANIEVTTNTNVAYVGGVAGQSNGLFCLSNNGDVTLETKGYEFCLGGISGSDSYTGNTSQLINQGDVEFKYNGTLENINAKHKMGGVIGQSNSKSFSDVYCDALISLPLAKNEYSVEDEWQIFGSVGLLVGNSLASSVTCDNCYYMNSVETYTGAHPIIQMTVEGASNDLSGVVTVSEEFIFAELESYFNLKPFGNITPKNKQGTNGLRVSYQNSFKQYKLKFNANQKLSAQSYEFLGTKQNSGIIFYEFYQDKIQIYQSGDDIQKESVSYGANNSITYLPMYNEGGSGLLYFWQKLKGFDNWPYSIVKIDNQDYYLRGGYSFKMLEYESYYNKILGNQEGFDKARMSLYWDIYDGFDNDDNIFKFDYVGPFSIVKNGNKCKFNLNLIYSGPEAFMDWKMSAGVLYPNYYYYDEWKKLRMEAYGGEFVQDTYTFAEFDLDKNNTKQFTSKKIGIKDIGGYFTSNFQSINNKYYAGASSSMFW